MPERAVFCLRGRAHMCTIYTPFYCFTVLTFCCGFPWSPMQRMQFHLTPDQTQSLRRASTSTGLAMAEIVRRALDAYLLATQPHRQPQPRPRGHHTVHCPPWEGL